MTFYNAAQPINILNTYTPYSVVEFLVKMPTGRQMKKGSLRVSGYLQVEKTDPLGNTSPIDGTEGIFFNQFTGIHSLFLNTNTTINNRTVESLQHYPRYVAMQSQHDGTPETMLTSSAHASELKGCLNNRLLVGNDAKKGISFSFKPHICINKTASDLPQSKFQEIKVMWQLGSAVDALYIAGGLPTLPTIAALSYNLTDLQLSWMEAPEDKSLLSQPTAMNSVFNMVQTITGLNNNIQINSATAFDSLSMSFLRQSSKNSLYKDAMLCEYVQDISRVEFLVNGQDSPLSYAILPPCYQDIALNYNNSLSTSGSVIWRTTVAEKNSIMNRFLSENGCFGVGVLFKTAINEKLQVALTLSDNISDSNNPSANPIDCYIYINGYLTL